MSYDKFVGELNKGIEGRIVAYDEHEEGCMLHLNDGCTVIVAPTVIDRQRDEALSALRAMIRAGEPDTPQSIVALRGGAIVIEPACAEPA